MTSRFTVFSASSFSEKKIGYKDLPLPVDLFTGEPFDWKAADGIGVLTAPKIPGVEHPAARIEYRIQIR